MWEKLKCNGTAAIPIIIPFSFFLLQINETLRTLKMNGNKIDNKGGMAIAGALQVNTILDDIDLAETDLVRLIT